jgi:hypothetical protein
MSNVNFFLYIGIFLILYGINKKYKTFIQPQELNITTPLLNQNIPYKSEFVDGNPSNVFSFMFGNSDPWVNRYSIDKQPRSLMEEKKEQEKQEETERIRRLM